MVRVLYVGVKSAPEFAALQDRTHGKVVETWDPEQKPAPPDAAALAGRIDAVVVASPHPTAWEFLGKVAPETPFQVSPGVLRGLAETKELAESAAMGGVTTSVSRHVRYAINLTHLRQAGRAKGVRLMTVRSFAPDGAQGALNAACDLVRYAGGEVSGILAAEAGDGADTALLRLESGAVCQLAVGTWQHATPELSAEILTGQERFGWFLGVNTILIDGENRYSVAEREEGFHVAAAGAFLTAVATGRTSPILSDLSDAVRTLELQDALAKAWGPADA